MILFKPEHVEPILSGRKTQTRRFWKTCRVKIGSVHQARTNMPWQDPSGLFAYIHMLDAEQQELAEMSQADVYAEGYDSLAEYMTALDFINNRIVSLHERPFVVTFELVAT